MNDRLREQPGVIAGTLKLAAFALVAATIVAGAWHITRERIESNRHSARMASFAPVLAGIAYTDIDYANPERIQAPHDLPGASDAFVYQASDNKRPVAKIYEVSARGYSGPIRLLIGIDRNDTVAGVRVLAHTETPGLGDWIDRERSDWIDSFAGRSLANTSKTDWALVSEGGEFDAFTGASITPRAVIEAVHETLEYNAERQ